MLDFWFPWYPALYRADTMQLTAEQDGIYRRLIDHYMETNQPLPDSMIAISRIAGVDFAAMEAAWVNISSYFTHRSGVGYTHRMCDRMLLDMGKRREKRVAVAKIASSARYKKNEQIQERLSSEHAHSMHDASFQHATGQDRKGKEDRILSKKDNIPPKSPKTKSVNNYSPEFESFWNAFPKNGASKAEALKSYNRAITSGASHDEIVAAVTEYHRYTERTGTAVAHATTWLNQQRWGVDYAGLTQQHQRNSGTHAPTHQRQLGFGGDSHGSAENRTAPKQSKWLTEGDRLAAEYLAEDGGTLHES